MLGSYKIHGIAFKPEYTEEPIVTLIGQLHANQVSIQEDYLSPLGLECLNFVNKMALSAAEAQSDIAHKTSKPYQDATQSLWEAVSAANQAPAITHTERFMDKKLLDSADHALGIAEKSAEALGLTKTPFIQGLKVVRDILILTKRLNDPQIDPMLVGIDATAHFLGEKVSKKTTKISKIVDGVVQEKDNHDPLERIICSAMGGVAQLSVDWAFSGVFALYKIPQFAGCMYKVALVRAGLGTAYGAASQNTTAFFANTLGDHVKEWSHQAFQKERERRLDENSTIADPDTLHLGFPVHPKQAQVLADKVSSGLTHVVETIKSTPTDAADLMDGMHTGMPVDNQQAQVLAKVASKVYQHVKQTVLSTPPDAANLMQGMDVGAPIDQNQAQVVGERLANAYHKVKECVLDATDKVGDLLSVNTRTPEQDSQLQQHLIAQIATENRIYQNLNPFIPKTTLPPLLNHHYNTPYYRLCP